jgi:exopolysaccharide production protein ExoQ
MPAGTLSELWGGVDGSVWTRFLLRDTPISGVAMTSIRELPTSHRNSTRSRLYYLAVTFFVLQASGAFGAIDRIQYGEWAAKPGDNLTQTLNFVQIIVSLFLFCVGYNRSKTIGLGGILLLAVVAFLFLSVLWSVDPETSLRRSFIYLFFALGVIGIANSLGADEYMQLMRRVVFFSAVASLALLAISPDYALMPEGAMRGVFTHKNVLGQIMAAGVLASLHGIRVGDGHWRSCVAMIIVFSGIVVAAGSATSLITIFAFCGAEILIALSRRARAVGIIVSFVSIPILVAFALWPNMILNFLGKDATLTGRTDLWSFVEIRISQRPLLGWGFDAFWSPINPAANEISTNLRWVVPQAHNGLLELLLEVGAIGTSLFAIVFLRDIWIGVRCLQTPAKELGVSLLLCCGGILLVGVSEEVLVDPSQISVGMLFVMGLIGERMLRVAAHQQRFRWSDARCAPATSIAPTGRTEC